VTGVERRLTDDQVPAAGLGDPRRGMPRRQAA